MGDDRVKRAERGSARAAEQVFKICELVPSGPLAESESRVARNFSPFSGAKDTEFRISWLGQERMGTARMRG